MSKPLVIMKLSKPFGNNNAGEVAGFTPDTAAHIVKHDGGKALAEINPKTERYDESLQKVVPLSASQAQAEDAAALRKKVAELEKQLAAKSGDNKDKKPAA